MLASAEIQSGLTGAWRMMAGRADGLRLLDLTADGFWNSFFAIVVAAPAMALGWIMLADQFSDVQAASRAGLVLRYAMRDLGTWVLPLVGLALTAKPAGIGDRFVPYVVASNWGSALLVWLTLPPTVVAMLAPGATDFVTLLSLLFYGVSLFLGWRLTNIAIGRGPAIGSAVFAGMFVASLMVLLALQALLGLAGP